jgi:cytochrome c556
MALKTVIVVLLLAAAGAAGARPPTPREALAAARQAAQEARSRDLMLAVADLTRTTDPAQALADYQAAFPMTDPLWFRTGTRVDNAERLATALQALGDTRDAKLVALDALDSLSQPPEQTTMNLSMWLSLLGTAVQGAYPYDHARALAALPVMENYLPQATDKWPALTGYLQALALKDPEAAYQR